MLLWAELLSTALSNSSRPSRVQHWRALVQIEPVPLARVRHALGLRRHTAYTRLLRMFNTSLHMVAIVRLGVRHDTGFAVPVWIP